MKISLDGGHNFLEIFFSNNNYRNTMSMTINNYNSLTYASFNSYYLDVSVNTSILSRFIKAEQIRPALDRDSLNLDNWLSMTLDRIDLDNDKLLQELIVEEFIEFMKDLKQALEKYKKYTKKLKVNMFNKKYINYSIDNKIFKINETVNYKNEHYTFQDLSADLTCKLQCTKSRKIITANLADVYHLNQEDSIKLRQKRKRTLLIESVNSDYKGCKIIKVKNAYFIDNNETLYKTFDLKTISECYLADERLKVMRKLEKYQFYKYPEFNWDDFEIDKSLLISVKDYAAYYKEDPKICGFITNYKKWFNHIVSLRTLQKRGFGRACIGGSKGFWKYLSFESKSYYSDEMEGQDNLYYYGDLFMAGVTIAKKKRHDLHSFFAGNTFRGGARIFNYFTPMGIEIDNCYGGKGESKDYFKSIYNGLKQPYKEIKDFKIMETYTEIRSNYSTMRDDELTMLGEDSVLLKEVII
jgi:hypothetical protein